jgi:hypothetical protein
MVGSQGEQVPPLLPQNMVEGIVQTLPSQQPPGHDVASQMHARPEQRWPGLHAAPEPQEQVPPLHPSATAPQSMQESPAAAHVVELRDVHV